MLRSLRGLLLLLPVSLQAHPVSLDSVWRHLVAYEGYRERPYRDGSGWSVGVGHSLTANRERAVWSRPYTHGEIVGLFHRDLSWAVDACRAGVARFDELPEAAQLVALGVAWTVGRTGFAGMQSFRACLSRRDFTGASRALGRSRWHTQVGPIRAQAYRNDLMNAACTKQ